MIPTTPTASTRSPAVIVTSSGEASTVRAYLFTLQDSRLAASRRSPWTREDWIDYLADRLRGDAEAENLLVQKNRGDGGLLEKARDIVLSLERAREELGIQLVLGNTTLLAAALCRFACDGDA